MHRRFRDRLDDELRARRTLNPRYSLRAFAAFLGADHSTLSQILRARRPAPAPQIRAWAKKLGLAPEEAAAYVAAEHLPGAETLEREEQVRHWTAEAMAVTMDRTHWDLLRLVRTAGFRADCRWIATEIGITVDQVNVALSRLLRLRLLHTTPAGAWIDGTDPPAATERDFRRIALGRVREFAAASRVTLPVSLRRRA